MSQSDKSDRSLKKPVDGGQTEREVDKHYKEGDFAIISSDNVEFRLPPFYMLAARYVSPHATFRLLLTRCRGELMA